MKNIKLNLFYLVLLALFIASCSNVEVSSTNNYEAVTFPDGSIAYLNKNSSVEYDEKFADRVVTQEGEVFYDVVKANNPFVVETESGKIKVLGTRFNVKSTDEELEVEVESGKIEFGADEHYIKLKNGQKAIFVKAKEKFKMAQAEFKYKLWIRRLKKEFKKLGRTIDNESKQINKRTQKVNKKVKKKIES